MLTVLHFYCFILKQFSPLLASISFIFPKSLRSLRNILRVNRNSFIKFVVCPKCHSIYNLDDVLTTIENVCTYCEYPQHPHRACRKPCGSPLVARIKLKDGSLRAYPHKIYCYKSLAESLKLHFSRPGVLLACEKWRQRTIPSNALHDIYDGRVWKELMHVNNTPFLAAPNNLGLMLNVDWFNPYKHSPYSVGAVYLVILNLPRSMRFKKENIILVGLIPGPHEPSLHINTYLDPLVEELNILWKDGIQILSPDAHDPITLRAALLCVACDTPATRKVCGFYGHMAKCGCSKCTKIFETNPDNGAMCYGGDFNTVSAPRKEDDHCAQAFLGQQQVSNAAKQRVESLSGSRFTSLMHLEYFDCIRFHIIDAMHNLFLGTAKHVMKNIWLNEDSPIIPKNRHTILQSKVDKCAFPSSLGRIPHKIASGFSSFTAGKWKIWTMTLSMYVLEGELEQTHLNCWHLFVRACQILVSPMLTIEEAEQGHDLLVKFCIEFERLYGIEKVTPNMHMHTHLVECIKDYGPVYAFWLFSFERYNGILGNYRTNNRSVEVQFMQHFMHDVQVDNLNIPVECLNVQTTTMQQLFNKDLSTGTLNDMCSEHSMEYCAVIACSKLSVHDVPTSIWSISAPYCLSGAASEHYLDGDSTLYLANAYQVMYKQDVINTHISFRAMSYTYIKNGNTVYGSIGSRSKRSCYILAAWCGKDGHVDKTTEELRPGHVMNYFQHNYTMLGNTKSHIFAFVKWYQHYQSHHATSSQVWCANLYEPFGPASFLPVQRIHSQFVAASTKLNDESVLYICPLQQKVF